MGFVFAVLVVVLVVYFIIAAILGSSQKGSTKMNNIHDKENRDLVNEALKGSAQFQKETERFIRKLERERTERLIHTREVMSITSRLTEDGLEFYRNRNDIEAIKCFEQCLEYPYPSWVAFNKLMDIYRERKDYENEIRVIERSIEILEADNIENGHISEYPIQPLIDRLNELDIFIFEKYKKANIRKFPPWTAEDQAELDELQRYNRQQGKILSKVSETNNKGIAFEKEGRIDEAIQVYEENILLKHPATHAYKRLMILYRRNKDYDNELRVIKIAIEVFMQENERRANDVIVEHPEWENIIMQAMETNEEARLDDGRYILNQYNVMEFINRAEKVKKIIEKNKTK